MGKIFELLKDKMPTEDRIDRISGRTTRLADNCIQEFFTKGYTFIKDHYPNEHADKYLLKIIRRRLEIEHGRIKFISPNDYYFNYCFIIAANDELLYKAKKELRKKLEKRRY